MTSPLRRFEPAELRGVDGIVRDLAEGGDRRGVRGMFGMRAEAHVSCLRFGVNRGRAG